MKPTHDSLGRRNRTRRISTGKRITLTERDLIWLQKIHEHGPLSSTYLHAFTQSRWRSSKRARDRLTDLFNESETLHDGAYLDRPFQQFRTLDARYNDLVYDLTDAAKAALQERGLWHDRAKRTAGPWHHRHMVSCITASIELATLNENSLNYIPQHAVLERANAALRYSVAYRDPASHREDRRDLIPDALFGLEYLDGPHRLYRFFVVEADRATEPTRTSQFNRKSHLRTMLQYGEYIGRELYKEHLILSAPLLVLVVSSRASTQQTMTRVAEELFPEGNNFMLFRTLEGSSDGLRPGPPTTDLLTGAWRRVGFPDFRID